ncbi:response regulator [Roseateles oligotrophus]|uniref:Response regulator n=1 Tax=Roseateles oligotrophus TaxID=1769250 RepID=A0ABT2YKB0_9BURK|nr:response regulator [Roseateles oligotrophus]MCV2370491.1 response regulator [Roseateles oligotrophus]
MSLLRILLLEDDRELRATLASALRVEGYELLCAASLAEARALLIHAEPADLILLDLGLPDGDGAELLAQLRHDKSTPVLIISAREQDAHKVQLLDAGADDYLVKPFSISELLARMRVALRHRGVHTRPAQTLYEQQGLRVDLAAHSVSLNGADIHLTPTEFKLLARLVRNAGQVLTHRTLLAEVWGPEFVEHTHYLRLYMGQLRAKLEATPADPQRLLTEPGVGYRLVEGGG